MTCVPIVGNPPDSREGQRLCTEREKTMWRRYETPEEIRVGDEVVTEGMKDSPWGTSIVVGFEVSGRSTLVHLARPHARLNGPALTSNGHKATPMVGVENYPVEIDVLVRRFLVYTDSNYEIYRSSCAENPPGLADISYRNGDTLPNGATVYDYRRTASGERFVMAYTGEGSVHPWVTWRLTPEGDTVHGNYAASKEKAREDFENRGR